ncbi:MAG: HDOD domain-containing protein [Deltaproteobacteria bacterium]|nr:HDOD domain-containing protein [Deltaproteobacteria bacterium]MBW2304253.1 HDOD domain-containing protein [Deltaproteobacteria bacterium]
MKILVVDDDPVSRRMVEHILRDMGECEVVGSGTEAVFSFKRAFERGAPFDAVTLDISMPKMDGRMVLHTIREMEKNLGVPQERRSKILMVTAHADKETVIKCVKMGCDDYITKPFDKNVIVRKIDRLGFGGDDGPNGKETLVALRKRILALIRKFEKGELQLPTLPRVAQEIEELMEDPSCEVDDLAALIERDTAISAKLISTVNSPYFRGTEKVQTVSKAIQRLGFRETRGIVAAIVNKSLYKAKTEQFQALMEELWMHSLACAQGAREIGKRLFFDDPEKLFFMGLTHDIGKVLLFRALDDPVLLQIPSTWSRILSIIQEVHTSFGGGILRKWGFGEEIVRVALHHEDPKLETDMSREIIVVNLANNLAHKMGFSPCQEKDRPRKLESARLLGINPGQVSEIIKLVKAFVNQTAIGN